jgi:hypothetical protein
VEGHHTPKRCRVYEDARQTRSVLECASPLTLYLAWRELALGYGARVCDPQRLRQAEGLRIWRG